MIRDLIIAIERFNALCKNSHGNVRVIGSIRIPEDTLIFKSQQKRFVADKIGFNKDNENYSKILDRIFIIYNTQRLDFKLRDLHQREESIAAFLTDDKSHIGKAYIMERSQMNTVVLNFTIVLGGEEKNSECLKKN